MKPIPMPAPAITTAIAVAIALSLTGCSVYREATSPLPDTTASWRRVATDADRTRLRNWQKAWDEALPLARLADAGAIAADPDLFDPDRALGAALPPPGAYRCRTFKLGAIGSRPTNFSTSPWFECVVTTQGDVSVLEKTNGIQRPIGQLYADTDARRVFIGAMVLGDETAPLRYGLDEKRDVAGYLERIGEQRWRLVIPYPRFESKLEVTELRPA